MFSSFSSYVWGSPEGVQGPNNEEVLFDDSKVTEDDWVLVEEVKNNSGSQEDGRATSLQTLFEENEPQFTESAKEKVSEPECSSENDNTDLSDKSSLGILFVDKQSDASDKSSLEILFADAQPSEGGTQDNSDISMKTDETDFGEKTSLQFLFDESLHNQSTGNNSTSQFTLKPLKPDPPIILAPNGGQSRHFYNRSYSADYYRGDPEVAIEPTVLRRRHVSRIPKRSGDSATALVGHVVLQKRAKQPGPEGTSGVGRGEETRRRTRRANSVACTQSDNTHGRRRKRTADKFSGKGGRRNC